MDEDTLIMIERNREILAERLGWPEGAVQACREIESRFPRWKVFYDTGGTSWCPGPSYRAVTADHRRGDPKPSDPTPEGLAEKVAQADRKLPRWW